MNKYATLGLGVIVILGGGFAYKAFLAPKSAAACPATGVTKNIRIVATKDRWEFKPEEIEVNCGDKVAMEVVNEDSYDHGIGIDAFGISQRMPANQTIRFEFTVTKPGDFSYFCSVPCGEGMVEGHKRTHNDMFGTMHVKSLVSETK